MSTRTRADDLAHFTVLDADRQAVELGTLWKDRTAVLVFVRHFGWLLCREHVVQLHRKNSDIRAAGAELCVIGNGAPMFMDGFRETTGYDGPLYTDPSLAVYKAAGLKRGVATVVSGRAALAGLRALRGGFRQGRTQGDPTQQGGVLVVAPSGDVRFAQISAYAGDNATPERVLASLRA